MYKCNICGEEFETVALVANHGRWKHRDQTEYLKKAKEQRVARITEQVICHKAGCETKFEVSYTPRTKKSKWFCSRSCANSRGPRTQAFKDAVSKKLKKPSMNERTNCKLCDVILLEAQRARKNVFCSRVCANQHRSNFYRENMEEKRKYRLDCSFKFNLKDYPDSFDFSLIEEYGWYSAANRGNNLNGVSRDHMYSVMEGYRNNIDPKLLSHPANCRLMRHNDNVAKCDKSTITIEELKKRIKEWEEKYN